MSQFHIVYPGGDRYILSVVEICEGLEYELTDYDVASRRSFSEKQDAEEYAEKLASENGLTFRKSGAYLD